MAAVKQNYYTLYKATSPSGKKHKKIEKKIKIKKGRTRKSILCKNTGIVYKNIDILCYEMKLIKGSVLAVCTNRRKACYGYEFCYVTGGVL